MSFFSKILKTFSDPNQKELNKIQPLIERVNQLEERYQKLTDEQIKAKTIEFKKQLQQGKTLDDLLPFAFAACREAGRRVIGQRAFDSQLIGAVALHQGKISEMKTGEGKTLAAVFAAYLNALAGRGVHIVTVNDYLARRDTNWMGAVYDFLGLSVGCIQHDMAYLYRPQTGPDEDEASIEYENLREASRRDAYQADITYGTNNEFGFDYLRDNMVQTLDQMVQVRDSQALAREEKKKMDQNHSHHKLDARSEKTMLKKRYLNFAIVDEVDSILIDESRTPLIISAPDTESAKLYVRCAKVVPKLVAEKDYNVDEKMQAVSLTDQGITKLESLLNIKNLYAPENMRWVHHLHQAVKAQVLFKIDKQYVVRDGEVVIVDDFTGRLMPGRRFSEGLHQALEAKEGVKVQRESKTLATITFQNFFRLYHKLSGMTGTALTSAEEFAKVYELEILSVPTNKEMIRNDRQDKVYKNEHGKLTAIAKEIKQRNRKGQPVLVGTISVEKSEMIAQYLDREGVPYEILNAKNHEREAQIIKQAGQKNAVTIATNMAGRGTDIKLGAGVTKLGGLHVIGTERHEARRIDNQLRGRAGRQGDPGSSIFYVSLEDELMRRFGSDRIKGMMDKLGLPEDQPIENKMISSSIESAQKKIEGHNFDIRKHVLEYDDVINRQREAIYQKRRQILLGLVGQEEIKNMIQQLAQNVVSLHTEDESPKKWNTKEIFEFNQALFSAPESFQEKINAVIEKETGELAEKKKELINLTTQNAAQSYEVKQKAIGPQILTQIERMIMLRTLDTLWMEHLDNMQFLREGIGLRGYGQRDPLIEYKKEGFELFQDLLANIRLQTVETLFKATIKKEEQPPATVPQKPIYGNNLKFQGADLSQNSLTATGQPEDNTSTATNQGATASGGSANSSGSSAPVQNAPRVGRNEPCPCGSGKKYKKCCGRRE